MKYVPAIICLILALLSWAASRGNQQGAAMSSSFMVVPAVGFGLLAVVAGVLAWAL